MWAMSSQRYIKEAILFCEPTPPHPFLAYPEISQKRYLFSRFQFPRRATEHQTQLIFIPWIRIHHQI
jgi:hypothetical protein